jgi:hypothetical protein
VPFLIGGAIAVVLLATSASIVWYIRRHPKDKEMQRRLKVNQHGRLGDATITEVDGDTVFYSYSVSGVTYAACQDISKLHDFIPVDPINFVGRAASLKYVPRNPANSILVCEQWSGLRPRP